MTWCFSLTWPFAGWTQMNGSGLGHHRSWDGGLLCCLRHLASLTARVVVMSTLAVCDLEEPRTGWRRQKMRSLSGQEGGGWAHEFLKFTCRRPQRGHTRKDWLASQKAESRTSATFSPSPPESSVFSKQHIYQRKHGQNCGDAVMMEVWHEIQYNSNNELSYHQRTTQRMQGKQCEHEVLYNHTVTCTYGSRLNAIYIWIDLYIIIYDTTFLYGEMVVYWYYLYTHNNIYVYIYNIHTSYLYPWLKSQAYPHAPGIGWPLCRAPSLVSQCCASGARPGEVPMRMGSSLKSHVILGWHPGIWISEDYV